MGIVVVAREEPLIELQAGVPGGDPQALRQSRPTLAMRRDVIFEEAASPVANHVWQLTPSDAIETKVREPGRNRD